MAFATANVRKSVFGDLKVMVGDWSGAVGDANGTINAEGARVYLMEFNSYDSNVAGPTQYIDCFVSSVSGSVSTVSVPNRRTVTNGRFIIISA